MNYKELIIECYSVSDFCRKIGFTTNGRDIKRAKNIIIDEIQWWNSSSGTNNLLLHEFRW